MFSRRSFLSRLTVFMGGATAVPTLVEAAPADPSPPEVLEPAHEPFPTGLYSIGGKLVLHGDSQVVACLPNNECWHVWVPESGPPVLHRNLAFETGRDLYFTKTGGAA